MDLGERHTLSPLRYLIPPLFSAGLRSRARGSPHDPLEMPLCLASNDRRETSGGKDHAAPRPEGAKKLVELFGDRLLFVRYRYDAKSRRR